MTIPHPWVPRCALCDEPRDSSRHDASASEPHGAGGVDPWAELRILTIEELSELCKVSVPTIYAWNTKGTGPRVTRVGKYARYRFVDVLAWMERSAQEMS